MNNTKIILRRIFGGKIMEKCWERHCNADIYSISNGPYIREVVK